MSNMIKYHQEPTGWWAETDLVPGFTAVANTLAEVVAETDACLASEEPVARQRAFLAMSEEYVNASQVLTKVLNADAAKIVSVEELALMAAIEIERLRFELASRGLPHVISR